MSNLYYAKECEFCSKSFEVKNKRKKYCSLKCRRKNFRKNNPEKMREYERRRIKIARKRISKSRERGNDEQHFRKAIGKIIEMKRKSLNLSTRELGKKLNLTSGGYISNLEKGKHTPNLYTLLLLADTFECLLSEFIEPLDIWSEKYEEKE